MKTKTVKIEGTIYMHMDGYSIGKIDFWAFPFDDAAWDRLEFSSKRMKLAPYTIEVELPDGIDLHKAILTSLQDKRKLILAENNQRLQAVDDEIQNHLALEHKAAA
jgi:hypothetical protein